MKTTFLTWLEARGERVHSFALRRHHNINTIYRLAGVASKPMGNQQFNSGLVEAVSKETGIPIGTLYEDAIKAAKKPTPPRPYRRRIKEEPDGTRPEAQE